VTITWTDNAADETGYELLKIAPGGQETTIALPANSTSYRVTGLTANTAYQFRVRATTAAQTSIWSPTISVTTLNTGQPIAPTDLVASNMGTGSGGHTINLNWTDNSNNETGFTIERQNSDTTWSVVDSLGANSTSYTVDSLNSLSDATFRVTATGTGGNSTSNTAEGSTDYGDGIVYSGAPSSSTTDGTFDGVAAHWSGPYDQIDPPLRNDSVSLTLDDLPDHYGLEVTFTSVVNNAGHTSTDTDTLTLSGLGSDVTRTFGQGFDSVGFLDATADHTDSSVTLTLTGSNFESGEVPKEWGNDHDVWGISGVTVRVLRYRPSLSLPTLTVQREEDEPVPIRVLKEDGAEATDVELSVVKQENLEASVGESENGLVLNLTGGVKLAAAMVMLQVAGGGRVAAATSVGPYDVFVVGEEFYPNLNSSALTFGVGQSTQFKIAVLDANGDELDNTKDPAPVATNNTTGGATLSMSFAPDPNSTSTWILTVTCDAQNITPWTAQPAGTTYIDITYPKNPPTVPPVKVYVNTVKYFLSVTPANWVLPAPLPPILVGVDIQEGDLVNFVATVTDSFGLPVEGVLISSNLAYSNFPRPYNPAFPGALLQPGAGVTTSLGKVMFWLSTIDWPGETEDVGYTATFKIGNGTDPGAKASVTGEIQ
jgi:hypothetical protein